MLASSGAGQETVYSGPGCPSGAPVQSYDVLAINVDITLNRFLDHDPGGYMYVLAENLEGVRAEEKQNEEARQGKADSADSKKGKGRRGKEVPEISADPAVSNGLQGDFIQPLVIRANQGECLVINFTNQLSNGESASLHIHGSTLYVASTGEAAIATNPDAMASPGGGITYKWWIAPDTQEGIHYFHSHGNERFQTGHGLFGALIVEPAGSKFLDPFTGEELKSGWLAIIEDSNGPDFREFVTIYHEIGNDAFRPLDREDGKLPLVDPITKSY